MDTIAMKMVRPKKGTTMDTIAIKTVKPENRNCNGYYSYKDG